MSNSQDSNETQIVREHNISQNAHGKIVAWVQAVSQKIETLVKIFNVRRYAWYGKTHISPIAAAPRAAMPSPAIVPRIVAGRQVLPPPPISAEYYPTFSRNLSTPPQTPLD